MKNIILSLFLLISLSAQAGIIIVSDLDDTIKITNSGSGTDSTWNSVFSNKIFTGMPEFLKASRHYVNEIHVLSASPLLLRLKIQSTLKQKGIEVDSLTLKNPLLGQTKLEYKVSEIKKMMEKKSGDDFIFLGDDVGQDPEVYDEIIKLYPNRVLASYIHVIKNREMPKSAIKYWTTYDLYLREFLAGRMLDSETAQAGDQIFGEARMGLIFPDFADCPKTPSVWLWQLKTRFAKDAAALMLKMNIYCAARRSTIAFE